MVQKKIWIWCLLCCLLLPLPVHAQEAEEADISAYIQDVIEELELSKLEELYLWAQPLFEENSLEDTLAELAQGDTRGLDAQAWLPLLWETLQQSIATSWRPMVQIIAMVLIGAVFRNLRLRQAGAADMAEWSGHILCCILAAWILVGCIRSVRESSAMLRQSVEALTPVLTVLLTAMGSIQTSAVLSPLMAVLTSGIFHIVDVVVIPAVLAKCVLDLGAGTSSLLHTESFSKLLGSGVKWLLGILFVVFLGVTALKGIAGSSIDGIYYKTAKYTLDKTVPIIGGMFSDTLDTLMACSMVVKNAVGIVGLLAMTMLLLSPLMGLMGKLFLLKLAAAAAGLFGAGSTQKLLERLAEGVTLLFAALLCMLVMAFIFLSVLMGAADAGLMMR